MISPAISRRNVLKATAAAAAVTGLGGSRIARADDKSVRVLVVADPFYYALDGVTKEFTERTGIKVSLESLSYEALQARLVSSFVSGQPDADIVSVDRIWLGQYLESRWIDPLDKYVKADKDVKVEDFIPEVIYSMNTWRGQLATLPVASYGMGVLYNKDYVADKGITIPSDGSWTWDQYVAAIAKMNGGTFGGRPMAGTVISAQQPAPIVHMYSQLAASMGARWFKSFPNAPWDFTPAINSPENIEAIKLFTSLYKNAPPESINYNWFDAGMRFAKGDVGMFYWWSAYFYLCRKDGYMSGKDSIIADKIGIVPVPHSSAPQVGAIGGWSLGMTSNSGAKDAAWQYIKWATSAPTQKKMALFDKFGHQFSDFGRKSLYDDADLLKIYPYLPEQLRGIQSGNGKVVLPNVPTYTTLESIYGMNLNKVLSGDMTPEDCASQTAMLWTGVLKGNFMIPYSLKSYDDTLDSTKALLTSLAG